MVCPNCGKDIEYLLCIATEYNRYIYNGEFELDDNYADDMEFKCPNCGAILTKDTEEADRILGLVKSKGVLAGVVP
jgi:predicted RNA-binding Zn-ribbon protein involved in translation (DUF1610 family)